MENGIRPPIQMAVDSMRNLCLGYAGEQNAQLIQIDVSKWQEKWPGASIDLMLALPGEKASYPAKTELKDGKLLFLPGYGDTQKPGHGAAYVVATKDGTHLAASETVMTEILLKGRGGDTLPEAPEAQAGWVADVLNAAKRAENAAEGAAAAVKEATEVAANRAENAAERAEEAAEKAENAEPDKKLELGLIDRLTTPFSVTGEKVVCYPVAGYPLDVVARIALKQEGSGDPSPSNMRPVSGWTEAKLHIAKKNLFDASEVNKTASGLTYKGDANGRMTITGTKKSGVNIHKVLTPGIILPAGTYTETIKLVSGTISNTVAESGLMFGINENTYAQRTTIVKTAGEIGKRTFTLAEPLEITSFDITPGYTSGGEVFNNVVVECQFEMASAATDFESGACDVYTAQFGETIYGGTLDWKTGKLEATWAKVAAADISWYAYGTYDYGARFITQFFDHFPDTAEAVAKIKANFCPAAHFQNNAPYQGKTFIQFSSGTSQTSLMVAQADVGAGVELTLDNVKSWLRSIDAYFVYDLKTPIEIQLTPQQILSLDGENTLWSDCGDITVSGPTEPKFRDEQQDIKIDEIADKTGMMDVMLNIVQQITDVEIGTWENGQKLIDGRRLRSREYYKVRAGTVVSFVPNGLYIYVHVYPDAPSNAAQTMLEASGWLGGSGEEIRYKIKNDGYAVFLFANGENWNASQTIYPEDYVSKTALLLYMADISNTEKLPTYWTKHIAEKIPEVNANSAACAVQGDSFIFFTDYHLEQTSGFSHLLMQDIVSKTSVRKVIFGGDIFNGAETHAGALEKTRVFIERFGGLNVYGIRGNHEYNLLDGGSVAERLTDSEIYNVTLKSVEDRVITNGKLSCYFDNTNRKIRYILIDSHQENESDIITAAELEWLQARMTELESGWTVMVFTHVMFIVTDKATATVSYLSNGRRIVNAIKAVKDSMAATLACLICGHAHFDYSSTDNGFLLVSTTCDSKQDSGQWIGWGKGAGTTAEHAFDVFSLDTVSRSLRAVRIGRGENREWNY